MAATSGIATPRESGSDFFPPCEEVVLAGGFHSQPVEQLPDDEGLLDFDDGTQQPTESDIPDALACQSGGSETHLAQFSQLRSLDVPGDVSPMIPAKAMPQGALRRVQASIPLPKERKNKRSKRAKQPSYSQKFAASLRKITLFFPKTQVEARFLAFATDRIVLLMVTSIISACFRAYLTFERHKKSKPVSPIDVVVLCLFALIGIVSVALKVGRASTRNWQVARLLEFCFALTVAVTCWNSFEYRRNVAVCHEGSAEVNWHCLRSLRVTTFAYILVVYMVPSRMAFAVPIMLLVVLSEVLFWTYLNPPEVSLAANLGRFLLLLTVTAIACYLLIRLEVIKRARFQTKEEMLRTQEVLCTIREDVQSLAKTLCLPCDFVQLSKREPVEDQSQLCSVCIATIDDFPSWCTNFRPMKAIQLLDTLWQRFDAERAANRVEKLFLHGDTMCTASGLRQVGSSFSKAEIHDPGDLVVFADRQVKTSRELMIPIRISFAVGPCSGVLIGKRISFYIPSGKALDDARAMMSIMEPQMLMITNDTAKRCESISLLTAGTLYADLVQVISARQPNAAPKVENTVASDANKENQQAPPSIEPGPDVALFSWKLFDRPSLGAEERMTRLKEDLVSLRGCGICLPKLQSLASSNYVQHLTQQEQFHVCVVNLLFYLVAFATTALQETLNKVSSILLAVVLGLAAATFVVPKITPHYIAAVTLFSILYQGMLFIIAISLSEPSIMNESLTWIIAPALPIVMHAALSLPHLAVVFSASAAGFIAVLTARFSPWAPSSSNADAGYEIFAYAAAGLCLYAVSRTQEVEGIATQVHETMKAATLVLLEEEMELRRWLLGTLVPRSVVAIAAMKHQEGTFIPENLCDSLCDLSVLEIKYFPSLHPFISRERVGIENSLRESSYSAAHYFSDLEAAVAGLPSDIGPQISIVRFDGDRALVAGPLGLPEETDNSKQPPATARGTDSDTHQQASRSLVQIAARLCTASSRLSIALARGEGNGALFGQHEPRFDVVGIVTRQTQQLLSASIPGQVVATHGFVQHLPPTDQAWVCSGLRVEPISEPWGCRGAGLLRVHIVKCVPGGSSSPTQEH